MQNVAVVKISAIWSAENGTKKKTPHGAKWWGYNNIINKLIFTWKIQRARRHAITIQRIGKIKQVLL
jgi:hypothetical protein